MVAIKASATTGVGEGDGAGDGVGDAVGVGVGLGFIDTVFDTPPHPDSANNAKDTRRAKDTKNGADVRSDTQSIDISFLGELFGLMPAAHHEFAQCWKTKIFRE
jgi:hypothetical protein